MQFFLTSLTLGLASQVLGRAVVDIEQRSHTDPVAHGNYANFHGVVQRWHEVGEDLFLTVDPDKWDDDVHVRRYISPEKRALANEPADMSLVPRSDLETRDWDQVCTVSLSCATAIQNGALWAGLTLAIPLNQLIVKITDVIGPRIWDILMRDDTQVGIIAGTIGVGSAGFISQMGIRVVNRFWPEVPAEEKDKVQSPAVCDESMSQDEMMRAIIRKGCLDNPERSSFDMTLKMPDGSHVTLGMGATPGGALSQSDICLEHTDDILEIE